VCLLCKNEFSINEIQISINKIKRRNTMLSHYSELNNENLINYAANLTEDTYGIFQINKIFNDIKNTIEFDLTSQKFQNASETYVMGRGNNFSKNMLLYSILKINDIDCSIKFKYVIDNTSIFSHKSVKFPWSSFM
jgi:hypothetical protein